jgi:hypothetical protein
METNERGSNLIFISFFCLFGVRNYGSSSRSGVLHYDLTSKQDTSSGAGNESKKLILIILIKYFQYLQSVELAFFAHLSRSGFDFEPLDESAPLKNATHALRTAN